MLAITDMFVLPNGQGDQRQPWIFVSVIVAPANTVDGGIDADPSSSSSSSPPPRQGGTTTTTGDSYRKDVCLTLNLNIFVSFLGTLEHRPRVCELNSFFEINHFSGYHPVVLHKPDSLYKADVALLPSRKGVDACILHLEFSSLLPVSPRQVKSCFTTPDSFVTGANLPLRGGWADFQREMFVGSTASGANNNHEDGTGKDNSLLIKRRVLAQNSLSSIVDLLSQQQQQQQQPATEIRMQLFATGDPDASTQWLKQIRIAIHYDREQRRRSVSAQNRPSTPVKTTVVTYHPCDRRSCLGCATLKLQALCYAAQQCAVVSCVGTVSSFRVDVQECGLGKPPARGRGRNQGGLIVAGSFSLSNSLFHTHTLSSFSFNDDAGSN